MKIIEYAPKIKCTIFGCDCQTTDANGIGDNVKVYVI